MSIDRGIAVIGNGLYCATRRRRSLLEEYRERQRLCQHDRRDPRGMCYHCGHIQNQEESHASDATH